MLMTLRAAELRDDLDVHLAQLCGRRGELADVALGRRAIRGVGQAQGAVGAVGAVGRRS
jgi:hypothetical protein